MTIDVITDFIHSVYSYDKGEKVIKMLESGELDIDTWAQDIYNKRQLCEDYILHAVEEEQLKILDILRRYHGRFKKSHQESYRQIRPFLNEKGELMQEDSISDRYHYFRCKQMENLIKYMEEILSLYPRKIREPKKITLFYERRFNDEQLELLFRSKTGHLRMTLNFANHPTGFNHMSVVLVHKVGFFCFKIHTFA